MILRFLILILVCVAAAHADEARVNALGQIEARARDIRVFRGEAQTTLFGSVTQEGSKVLFAPALPCVPGESYRIEFQKTDGTWATERLRFTLPQADAPVVSLAPSPALLPANALKLYLHFSQPMEQGVFLDRLMLQRQDASVVHGAFRETELWSPDGKRLTLWLHPGRQKTGVNLNQDEGPVLIEGETQVLKVSGTWRSTSGTPIGKDLSFTLTVGAPDHASPDPQRWQLTPPPVSTRHPLRVVFDEPLDPAMLTSAIRVHQDGTEIIGEVSVATDARAWSFVPSQPWPAGKHQMKIDPLLEDLAGNNLLGPFEVDRDREPAPQAPATTLEFEVAAKG